MSSRSVLVAVVCIGALPSVACTPISKVGAGLERGDAAMDGGAASATDAGTDAQPAPQPDGRMPDDDGPRGGGGGTGGAAGAAGAGAGGSGIGGTGGDAGTSDSDAQPPMEVPESCDTEGATRCAAEGGGARERCMEGIWEPAPPCENGEVCRAASGTEAECAESVELCQGSGGAAVCDAQGTLLVCNADNTIAKQEACRSPALCQAGLESQTCPVCVAGVETQCTGKTLEVCADDGMSFVAKVECETAALCNPIAGMCTDATCAPRATTCRDNTLLRCNEDGTAFASMTPCGEGSCDAMGGDCNTCTPGQKTCEGNRVLTCDETGQNRDAAACPSGEKCVGAGRCVECAADADCASLTTGCVVGTCVANACTTKHAPAGKACTASGDRPGTCSSGMCMCTPQCDKECGPDGCGGMCPNRCGSRMCVDGECVECVQDSTCPSDPAACKVGDCSGGTCRLVSAADDTECARGGRCRGGSCCVPDCAGKCDVDDGCGGMCPSSCSGGAACIEGRCCTPDCSGKCGGDDGCGGTCSASCANGQRCFEDRCCTPNCSDRCLVADGCGDTCPDSCSGSLECVDGTCQSVAVCGDGRVNGAEECDFTAPGFDEYNCSPSCTHITSYTHCGPGWPECLHGTVCNLGMCSRPCATSDDCDLVAGQPGLDTYCPAPRGTICVIGCSADQDCPPGALCNGAAVCEYP